MSLNVFNVKISGLWCSYYIRGPTIRYKLLSIVNQSMNLFEILMMTGLTHSCSHTMLKSSLSCFCCYHNTCHTAQTHTAIELKNVNMHLLITREWICNNCDNQLMVFKQTWHKKSLVSASEMQIFSIFLTFFMIVNFFDFGKLWWAFSTICWNFMNHYY